MTKSNFPELTQQEVLRIDATPDKNYPLRILQAYRENCNCRWSNTCYPDLETTDPMLHLMNQDQEQRAKILDEAIKKIS